MAAPTTSLPFQDPSQTQHHSELQVDSDQELLDAVHDAVSSPVTPAFANLDPRLDDFEAISDSLTNPQDPLSAPSLPQSSTDHHGLPTDAAGLPAATAGAQSTSLGAGAATQDLGQPEDFAAASLEELLEYLQTFAKEHGFALVRSSLRRREQDGKPTRLNLLCDRHGHLRNHRGLTDETRVRKKRTSRGVGCSYRIAVTLSREEGQPKADSAASHPQEIQFNASGNDVNTSNIDPELNIQAGTTVPPPLPATTGEEMYHFKVSSEFHNHAPAMASAHWKHRQLGPAEMKKIRGWYVEKKTPKDMLELLKQENPDSLYKLKDVQNARAKARAQYMEFIEGTTPSKNK